MNNKNRKMLVVIFQKPVLANIALRDIETMLMALRAFVEEAEGSRVLIELNGMIAVFHRPHPHKETDRGAIKSMRNLCK